MRIHVTTAPNSVPWRLPADIFTARLAEYRADAQSVMRTQGEREYVHFDLELDGERYEGGYFPQEQLILWDATIDAWAPVIEWFLNLLPYNADADTFLESVAIPQELPRNATAPDIARILTTLDAAY